MKFDPKMTLLQCLASKVKFLVFWDLFVVKSPSPGVGLPSRSQLNSHRFAMWCTTNLKTNRSVSVCVSVCLSVCLCVRLVKWEPVEDSFWHAFWSRVLSGSIPHVCL